MPSRTRRSFCSRVSAASSSAIQRNNFVSADLRATNSTAMVTLEPLVQTRPAVQMPAAANHRFPGGFQADIAGESAVIASIPVIAAVAVTAAAIAAARRHLPPPLTHRPRSPLAAAPANQIAAPLLVKIHEIPPAKKRDWGAEEGRKAPIGPSRCQSVTSLPAPGPARAAAAAAAPPGAMEVSVGTAALALALLLLPLLYERCGSFRFFCKMGFYNGWILLLALVAIPLCALRGRDVENMKIIRGLMQHVKRLYGIRMVVRGTQNFPPRQPYVVVSNHQSSLDLLGMMEVLPDRCVPIAKRELLYMGAVGVACWLGGIIFIDRKRTHDAISVMAEAAHTMLSQDVRVWVFPEGTRNHSGSMLPFKRGAFHLAVQAQVPVVPIVISSYQHFYSKRERRFTAGQCVIQVLPPLPTLGLGPADVPALTDKVRAAMLDAFEALEAELRPIATESDPQRPIATQSDPRQPTEPQSDPQSDPRQPTAARSDPRCSTATKCDHQSDPQHPMASKSDHQNDPQHPVVTQSDPRRARGTKSDPQCPTATQSDPQSDPQTPTGTRSDPWSDQQSAMATQSDPQCSTAVKSDHQSDPWRPKGPHGDPQQPTVTHGENLQ